MVLGRVLIVFQLMIDGIRNNLKIKAYLFDSYWLDIGRDDDYQMANEDRH